MSTDPFRLFEERLTIAEMVAGDERTLVLTDSVAESVRNAADEAAAAAERGAAYGRTTGVGANRDVAADDADGEHGLRLVRSHAAGGGEDLGADVANSTMRIRSQQLAHPGSGVPLDVLVALVAATNDGRAMPVRRFGGVGTGDITVLADLALALLGEAPWRDGTTHRYLDHLGANAALAIMSSSAPTLAIAAHAAAELRDVAWAALANAVIGAHAVGANPQQWSSVAESVRPSPGVSSASRAMRRFAGDVTPSRTQDPFGWRAVPYVLGPMLDVLDALDDEIERCVNAGTENPRFADGAVWHHGGFHHTSLALALDTARLALVQWVTLSLSRQVKLNDPAYTGATRFLAEGPPGSSGAMVLEYTASSALEEVRTLADPTTRHTTTISIGTEDHATFAWRGAIAARDAARAARTVVACELLTATRALRVTGRRSPALEPLLAACSSLSVEDADRPLVDDLRVAEALLAPIALVASAS